MSEGERTALYLIARVMSCQSNIMVVDEPEVFFHPLLARNLWDDLEAAMPEVRFIYITHDIPFALSRQGAQFLIARSESHAELLPETSSIPSEVIAEVLGAATFSISASRLIFCEGGPNSIDGPILSSWHDCRNTAVVPVGSCDAVKECVDVFRQKTVTSGLEAFGYIDRNGWPDSHLTIQHVKAHPVSEIEGIFALEPIFKALAKFNGSDEDDAQAQFDSFLTEARRAFNGVLLNKQILIRAKQRVELELKALLNPVKPDKELATVRSAFEKAAPQNGWQTYLGAMFAEEESRLTASLNGNPADFVRDFPAKSYLDNVAKHLKFVPDKMVETLCDALRLSDAQGGKEEKLKELRDSIVPVLGEFLWPRSV